MKKVIFILTMLLVSIGMSAQTHTVTGVVTDVDHEPMVGVSIIEKGTSNGAMTDLDGRFATRPRLMLYLKKTISNLTKW